MRDEQEEEIHQGIANIFRRDSLYCSIHVWRDNLLEDSLNELHSATNHLRKPLSIKFEGEPGVDAGGVQKEFF